MTKLIVLVLVLIGVVCAQAALIRKKRYDILGSPVQQESNCPSDGIFPIPGDCTAYIICKNGRERKRQCHDGMRYDSVKFCTPDEDADCGVVTAEAQAMVDLCPREYGIFPVPGNCQQYVMCHDGRGTVQTCPEGTGYVSHVGCSDEVKCAMHGPVKPIGNCPSDGIFPIPGDCTAYTICKDGRERKRQCPDGMRYDSVKFCTLDEDADCGVVTAEAQAMVDLCPSMYGMFPVPNSCNQYVICHEGRGAVQTCPEGTVYESHVGCSAVAQCTMHGPRKLKDRKACDLPLDSGPCYGAIPKFYYDKDSNSCKGFTYGGCEGNDNKFDSKRECMMTCFPEKRECPSDGIFPIPGDCTAYTICKDGRERKRQCPDGMRYDSVKFCTLDENADCGMVSFEAQAMADLCPRMYGIFPVPGICDQYVVCHDGRGKLETCPEGTVYVSHVGCSAEASCPPAKGPEKPKDKKVCDLPLDSGPCYGDIPKFYYDKDSKSCKGFTYGGCEGNGNNFNSKSECMMTCYPEKHWNVCYLPRDSGPCYGDIPRFYYDMDSKSCKGFTYGGCEGNGNNFETKRECKEKCLLEQ